ncbi:endonuclease domain of the non-LTR retrotransposon LINE-1 [Elysia marginata]|uniref:Endonuclease domain of the non-LTR retrotransposon LINE-1 n=1 Tax=Elysia marginata TaxID=1093978 RepID=A0AAV4FJ76_9GAST|nr:endonuclease domain of the non-LTR retrotransposon LINE-1 [Elysia marginata]
MYTFSRRACSDAIYLAAATRHQRHYRQGLALIHTLTDENFNGTVRVVTTTTEKRKQTRRKHRGGTRKVRKIETIYGMFNHTDFQLTTRKGGINKLNLVHITLTHPERTYYYKNNVFKPYIPSIITGNVRYITNKMEELYACAKYGETFRVCSLLCFTESSLQPEMLDGSFKLDNFTLLRGDRDLQATGKLSGGGVYVQSAARTYSFRLLTSYNLLEYQNNENITWSDAANPLDCARLTYSHCCKPKAFFYHPASKKCRPVFWEEEDIAARSGNVSLFDAAGSNLYEFKNSACEGKYKTHEYWSGGKRMIACLYFEQKIKSFFPNSNSRCKLSGGSLAAAKSLEKLALLRQTAPNDEFWVGLEKTDSVYTWKQDGSVMSPEKMEELFAPGFPNSYPQWDCVKMGMPPDTKLKNYACLAQYKFFCEARPDQDEPPTRRKPAVVWHGEGWAPPCDIAQDTQHEDENHAKIHTGSVVARTKDRLFRWQDPPEQRWKLCYWRIH